MNGAILIDFGSTYTKVAAASLDERRVLFTARFHSTVNSDAGIGLAQCLDAARNAVGKKYFSEAVKLASSSAAGGLRMGVIGLSRSLSITAGRNTVFGAGAKILKTLSGMITEGDAESLSLSNLEILLFCGGYERGSRLALLHNAEVLAHSRLDIPIIYAGNSSIARDVRRILTLRGKECFIVDNIIPNVGELNPLPAQSAIRDVFMKRIVNMKGLEGVSKSLDGVLMPTPAAVLSAGDLLSKGWNGGQSFGDMMIVDIGGATTDIHSFAQQLPYKGARLIGASEAYAKRTVEGDLGMRESSNSLAEEIGWDFLAKKSGMVTSNLEGAIFHRVHFNAFLPETDQERELIGSSPAEPHELHPGGTQVFWSPFTPVTVR